MLTGLTRKSFADNCDISMPTLRAWEEPPSGRNGLTDKGAQRFIKALNFLGVTCTIEWLFTGVGFGPRLLQSITRHQDDILDGITWGEDETILKDIASFKKNNPDPIIMLISDTSMQPYYEYGDYVAGNKKYASDIEGLIGLNCIVEFNGETLVRKIVSMSLQKKYTLSVLSMDGIVSFPYLTDVEIFSAAEIVWIRKKQRT